MSSANWKLKDATIQLSAAVTRKIDALALDFFTERSKVLTVTDGNRTPLNQAERMYYKFSNGDFTTYRGPQGAELAEVYRAGAKAEKSREEIIAAMAETIAANLKLGKVVSKHLLNNAADFSIRGLTPSDIRYLRAAISRQGGISLQEGIPPHIHASF